MTDINPYDEMIYQPEQIRDFVDEDFDFDGYADELYNLMKKNFEAYEELYERSVEHEIKDGVYMDAELFDKARAELEIANKLMERLVIDLQCRDGASSIADCTIVAKGEK